jgi:hypothetical protein
MDPPLVSARFIASAPTVYFPAKSTTREKDASCCFYHTEGKKGEANQRHKLFLTKVEQIAIQSKKNCFAFNFWRKLEHSVV